MENNYLIPANSKRSMLIFGIFKKIDLIIFGSGLGVTLLMLTILPSMQSTLVAVLTIAPGLITGFLVMPMPNYHNVLTFIISMYKFYTERQKFVWKGWCFLSEKEK